MLEKDLLQISPLAIDMADDPQLVVGYSVVVEGSSHLGFRKKLLKERSEISVGIRENYGLKIMTNMESLFLKSHD